MIKYKTKKEEQKFNSIFMDPYVFWKVHILARTAEDLYGMDLWITSVHRLDSKPHREWRAVDIRVRYRGLVIISQKQYLELRKIHNNKIRKFGNYDSFWKHEAFDKKGKVEEFIYIVRHLY